MVSLLAIPWPRAVLAAAGPHPDRAEVRDKLDDILSRPEFGRGLALSASWFERLIAGFVAWLRSLHNDAPLLFWLLLALCVLALAALLVFVTVKVRRVFFLEEGHRKRDVDTARREELSRIYREEARLRAGRGEFTEAIRYLFLSLVFLFDESGRVLFPRAFTNREYLRLFEERPEIAAELRVFVDALDDHWYGLRPAEEEQFRGCLGLYEHLAARRA